MSSKTDKYLSTLGVPKSASLQVIKKAYRSRVKQLHPDVNESPNAHDEFIELQEAYEFLYNRKTGNVYSSRQKKYKRHSADASEQERIWEQREKQRVRKRAKEHAQMRFDQFVNSDFYKLTKALGVSVDHLIFYGGVFLFFATPVFIIYSLGTVGIGYSLLILFISSPFWYFVYTHRKNTNFGVFIKSFYLISKTYTFQIVFITIFNLLLFFFIILNTLVTLQHVAIAILSVSFAGFIFHLLIRKFKGIYRKVWLMGCLCPALVFVFFLSNFLFSKNPVTEEYAIENKVKQFQYEEDESTTVVLESNQFQEYWGIRTFGNYKKLEGKDSVSYTFEEGIFGFRVMKSYELF